MTETDWFPATKKMKPKRIGFYKTNAVYTQDGVKPCWYQFWNGKHWGMIQWSTYWHFNSETPSKYQDVEWKGLTEETKAENI